MMEWLFILILVFCTLGLIVIVVGKILEFKDRNKPHYSVLWSPTLNAHIRCYWITKASDIQKIPESALLVKTEFGLTASTSLNLTERCKRLNTVMFTQSSYEQTSIPAVTNLAFHGVRLIYDEQTQKHLPEITPADVEKYTALREGGMSLVEMAEYIPHYVTVYEHGFDREEKKKRRRNSS